MLVRMRKRYFFGVGSVLIFIIFYLLWQNINANQLIHTSIVSGYLLLSMLALLALFNLRKRFSFLPLGSASMWLQAHIYIGYMAIFLFLSHIDFRWPNGIIEITLAILFIIVALSGIIGLIMSNMIPSRLTAHGGNVSFEGIPELSRNIKKQAEDMVIDSVQCTGKSTIADFYVNHLEMFFLRSRRLSLNHVLGSSHHTEPLFARIHAVRRYLNKGENEIMDRLEDSIATKDNLDYQYTWQWLLKAWLFIHIPLSCALLVLGSFHGLLALQFLGE